jgi:hypothetical protein
MQKRGGENKRKKEENQHLNNEGEREKKVHGCIYFVVKR